MKDFFQVSYDHTMTELVQGKPPTGASTTGADSIKIHETDSNPIQTNEINSNRQRRICRIVIVSVLILLIIFVPLIIVMTTNSNNGSNSNSSNSYCDNNLLECDLDNIYDYIIIGAGPGGLYIAESLLANNNSLNVLMIEKLNRVGGCTFSLKLEYSSDGSFGNNSSNINYIHLEMGGMRFLDSHTYVNKLLNYLNICNQKEVFITGTRGIDNPYYLRGNRFTVGESLNDSSYWKNTFNFGNDEDCNIQGWTGGWPSCIINEIWRRVQLENNETFLPSNSIDWQYIRNNWTYNNIP